MFTGIITSIGQIAASDSIGEDRRIKIAAPGLDWTAIALGDSIAVDGVCLTVTDFDAADPGAAWFCADVSCETLRLTTLGSRQLEDRVNLEAALKAGQAIGGHLVSGHVDGVGELQQRHSDARSECMWFNVPTALKRYIAKKGSVCVNGVSLTVNAVDDERFAVNLVPHTLEQTNLAALQPGDAVNIEVDMLARYMERLLENGVDLAGRADRYC